MKNFYISIIPFLVSCATFSHKPAETHHDQGSTSSLKFETTNSPCLDAMLINMISSGCQSITGEESLRGDTRYTCSAGPQTSSWNSSTFYVISHEAYDKVGISPEFGNIIPFCGDVFVLMFIED